VWTTWMSKDGTGGLCKGQYTKELG